MLRAAAVPNDYSWAASVADATIKQKTGTIPAREINLRIGVGRELLTFGWQVCLNGQELRVGVNTQSTPTACLMISAPRSSRKPRNAAAIGDSLFSRR